MTVVYPNPCYKQVCYKVTVLYVHHSNRVLICEKNLLHIIITGRGKITEQTIRNGISELYFLKLQVSGLLILHHKEENNVGPE